MRTEEELSASRIGGPPSSGPVVLVDYDPEWPQLFTREAERIGAALGERALQIEHAGSTSVPGLAAKPVIDIVLVVADSADEAAYVPPLEAAGYVLRVREPEWFEHRLFKRLVPNVNLHVFTVGSPEVDRMLLFRDHLRLDAPDRRLYESTKAALAEQDWPTVQHYADAKSDVVGVILARAMAIRESAD